MRTEPYSDDEIYGIVQAMPDERLRENYAKAIENPGTDARSWDKLLGAEMRKRGLALEERQARGRRS